MKLSALVTFLVTEAKHLIPKVINWLTIYGDFSAKSTGSRQSGAAEERQCSAKQGRQKAVKSRGLYSLFLPILYSIWAPELRVAAILPADRFGNHIFLISASNTRSNRL